MRQLHRIYLSLSTSEAVRQSILMTSGTVVTAGLSAIALLYASRLLGPEKFGVFSVGISIMLIIGKAGDMGLNILLTRQLPKLQDQPALAKEFLGQVARMKLGLIIVGIILASAFNQPIKTFFHFPYPDLFWLAVVGSLCLVIYEHALIVLGALHKFGWVSLINMLQAGLKVGFFVGLGWYGATVFSITLVYYLAPMLGVFLVLGQSREWLLTWSPKLSSEFLQTVRKHLGHGSLAVVCATLISNLDILLVQRYLTEFETGLYAGAMRVSLVVVLLGASIGGVLNNRVARYQTRSLLLSYLKKSSLVFTLCVLGFLTFLPVSKLILLLTLGEQYLPGLLTMDLLVANAFLSFAIIPYISFFYAVDRPAYFSLGGLLQVVVMVLGNVLFVSQYGLPAAALTKLAATTAHGVFTGGFVWWAYNQTKE